MEIPSKLAFPIMMISVLVACSPTEAWYKQVAGPSYYSVGRASGLLSGIRRSAYVRREAPHQSETEDTATNNVLSELTAPSSILKTMPICIRDVLPNLKSCEHVQELQGSFRCKAEVFLSLDSSDCEGD